MLNEDDTFVGAPITHQPQIQGSDTFSDYNVVPNWSKEKVCLPIGATSPVSQTPDNLKKTPVMIRPFPKADQNKN